MSDGKATPEVPQNIDLTLLANFTHQVINPLNGVAGTLDNISDGTIGSDRREQRTLAARAQLENCITLIRNLAYLASGDAAFSQSDNRTIVLPQVIIEAAMFYQEEGRSRNVVINLKNRSQQNKVKGHVETMKQVLMNIFDNSIKYSRKNSEVEVVQWIQKDTGQAVITIRSEPEYVLTGQDLASLFSLGFRGNNARQMVASGTGLGLHICKQLIEDRHGGSITVQKDKTGLLFTIKVPGAWEDE